MAAPTVVVIAHLTTTSKATRDELLQFLHKVVENTRTNEPNTLKYGVCIPDDAGDETNVYVIEEYADKAAIGAHMQSEPVQKMIAAGSTLLSNTQLDCVSWLPTAVLARRERLPSQHPKTEQFDLRGRVEKPYVLYATITDADVEDIDALEPYGAAIVKYATENEPDTIFYGDARPIDLPPFTQEGNSERGFICAVEAYASKEACLKHLQDESVKNLAVKGRNLGSKFAIAQLNMVDGFFVRET